MPQKKVYVCDICGAQIDKGDSLERGWVRVKYDQMLESYKRSGNHVHKKRSWFWDRVYICPECQETIYRYCRAKN
jgi:predicted RNA-binding Zn-ribbon protein involved in translation (DUF1610 family)